MLCNEAFQAWLTLLNTLDEEDIAGLIEPTFAIFAQQWDKLTEESQGRAYEAAALVFDKYPNKIESLATLIPSVAGIPLLGKLEAKLERARSQEDQQHRFDTFAIRCRNENAPVVSQAVSELLNFLEAHQSYLHETATTEQPNPVLENFVRSLLDACTRFSEEHSNLALNIGKCLGIIGCLDPTKIEMPEDKKEMIVLSNFASGNETLDFILFFIQQILVKAFLSACYILSHGFLSYAIQELLRTSGFEARNTLRRNPEADALYKRWIDLPQELRNILGPLITSQYVLAPTAPLSHSTYPVYDLQMSYAGWLRQITLDLLEKCEGEWAELVFDICKRIIRRQDLAIPKFLLPYISLNVVLGGVQEHRTEIASEFLHILSQRPPGDSQTAWESLLSCSQVSRRHLPCLVN